MKKRILYPGNLVEVLFGHPLWEMDKDGNVKTIDMSPELVNQRAVVKEKSGNQYSLIFLADGNEQAWFTNSQLKYISKGGPHLFKKAEKARKEIRKRNSDINFIKDNLENSLSSDSILKLFSLLGHTSAFLRNGEFYALYYDWAILQQIFIQIKNAKTLEEARMAFTEQGNREYNVEAVFNAFHS